MIAPWDAPELTSWRRLPMHTLRHADPASRTALGGRWRFQLLPTPDTALAGRWAEIDVPGCWTMQEFDDLHAVGDRPQYTNVQMPWPDLPPHPPAANPTGVYERDVDVPAEWTGRRIVLHVGAAESVLMVQVNGIDVGISKDSHLAAEFDVTELVRPGGANTVRLTVVKWSDASFIEDQDQWWHGGITRPVFLYATETTYLGDVRVHAAASGELSVEVDVTTTTGDWAWGWSATARIDELGVALAARVDPGDTPAEELGPRFDAPDVPGRLRMSAATSGVRPWSAETPVLYRLDGDAARPGRRAGGASGLPDRLPHRRDRRHRPAGQRRADLHARRQPARLPSGHGSGADAGAAPRGPGAGQAIRLQRRTHLALSRTTRRCWTSPTSSGCTSSTRRTSSPTPTPTGSPTTRAT